MAVVDIRGTHGSGKSHIPIFLLHKYDHDDITEGDKHLGYYIPQLKLAIVGKYSNQCGGCDGVGGPDEVVRRTKLFVRRYTNVLLEGILVSHTFKRYKELAKAVPGRYVFCFLDTPLAKCIARVRGRRLKAGNRKPFDPKKVKKDYACIWQSVRSKCVEAGLEVVVLKWQDPFSTLLEQLDEEE